MEGGIQNSLDTLAQNGVLNFDATSYLQGTSPRYAGSLPQQYLPFDAPLGSYQNNQPMLLPQGTKLPAQAHNDELIKNGEKNVGTESTWKKVLFGAIATGLILGGGYKIAKFLGKRGTKKAAQAVEGSTKNGFKTKVSNIIGSVKSKAGSVLKSLKGKIKK